MTREELRDYVEEQRNLGIIPYHVYSTLIDGIDTFLSEKEWRFYYDHGYAQAKRDLSENKSEWIPISSINEIPKEGAYWVTFEYENGYRETSHIGWDKFHGRWDDEEGWALDNKDCIIAYMPYFEPKPYKAKVEKGDEENEDSN